jgi:hypothetical protein
MHWPIRHTLISSLEILEKSNDECILILVIYWEKTGLLCTKISNRNLLIIETQNIVVTATKTIFMVFMVDASLIDAQVFISLEINTYPQHIRCSSNLSHIFRE